jgi:hypothetical protein
MDRSALAVPERLECATVLATYASPASRHYGCQAPAWVQHHPCLMRAWARARALRWSSALAARLALVTVAALAWRSPRWHGA